MGNVALAAEAMVLGVKAVAATKSSEDWADGTLSIFGTMVDHSASPAPGGLAALDLAAISRELAYNDPQRTPAAGSRTPADRNVEMIIVSPLAP